MRFHASDGHTLRRHRVVLHRTSTDLDRPGHENHVEPSLFDLITGKTAETDVHPPSVRSKTIATIVLFLLFLLFIVALSDARPLFEMKTALTSWA